jgi:hypothetical protein
MCHHTDSFAVCAVLRPGATSLDPSGILHMVTFVTLCKAYMGIEPHFDLWNYFFRTGLQ